MRRLWWVGLLLLCCGSSAWAVEKMADVVVTATRTSTDLQKVGGASVTVITAEEIEARHLTSVVDVLNTVPGLQISNVGGLGSTSKVFMRGADSKDTLLLIDGVIVNDPTDTNRGADFANISLDNVERIEVVRGAMSVLYGSNATAGVINIITKSGTEKIQGYVGGEAGTYNTHKLYGGVTGSAGVSDFSLSVAHLTTDGYSLANADNNSIAHAGNTSEDDGWENTTFSGKISADICSSARINAVVRYVDTEMDGDDAYYDFMAGGGYAVDRAIFWGSALDPNGVKNNHTDSNKFFGRVNLHNRVSDDTFISDVDYKYSRQKREIYDNDDAPSFDSLGEIDEWSWQGTWYVIPENALTAGVSYMQEKMSSSSSEHADATTKSYWLQDQFIYSGVDVVLGVRYDDHESFGGKATWRVAPAYHFATTGTTLRASYATGFRAPALYELYSEYGSNDLDPEKSKSWEIGLEQALLNAALDVGVTYFNMTFDDRIGWDYSKSVPGALYPGGYNQLNGESSTEGFEFFATYRILAPLVLTATYTYNDTQDPDGARMSRRPLHKVHAGVKYAFSAAGNINIDGYWVDERDTISSARDAQLNSVSSLDDYFLVNLAADYNVTDMLMIYARVDNLFDEHYEEAWSYATPGQSFYVGAKLTF